MFKKFFGKCIPLSVPIIVLAIAVLLRDRSVKGDHKTHVLFQKTDGDAEAKSEQNVEEEIAAIKSAALPPGEKGARLKVFIRPGMESNEVLRLLGPASTAGTSFGYSMSYYDYNLIVHFNSIDLVTSVSLYPFPGGK